MRMKRFARVFTSAMLAGAMMMTMGGMTAFADVLTEIPVNKDVNTPTYTFAPNATFKFEMVEVTEDTTLETNAFSGVDGAGTGSGSSLLAMAGNKVPGGVTLSGGSVVFDVNSRATEGTDKWVYSGTAGKLVLDEDAFNGTYAGTSNKVQPGIYHYQIKENAVSSTHVEGMSYDTTVRDIYVYVSYDTTTQRNTISNVIIAKDGVKDGMTDDTHNSSSVTFVNDYNGKTDPDPNKPYEPTGESKFYDLIVEKVVEGNQGERGRDFSFNLGVTSGNRDNMYVTFSDTSNSKATMDIEEDGAIVLNDFKLKDGEKVTIHNLLAGVDGYNVEEVVGSLRAEGYTVKVFNGNEDAIVDFSEIAESNSVDKTGENKYTVKEGDSVKNQKVVIENKKDVTTPTGIVLSFAPYIMLVALAGVFAVLFLRKKKEEF